MIMRAQQVRDYFGVSNITLYRWIQLGKLPEPQYMNNQRVWQEDEIELAATQMMDSEFTSTNLLVGDE